MRKRIFGSYDRTVVSWALQVRLLFPDGKGEFVVTGGRCIRIFKLEFDAFFLLKGNRDPDEGEQIDCSIRSTLNCLCGNAADTVPSPLV